MDNSVAHIIPASESELTKNAEQLFEDLTRVIREGPVDFNAIITALSWSIATALAMVTSDPDKVREAAASVSSLIEMEHARRMGNGVIGNA